MRILRLDLDNGEELDLHPFVTVLGGLSSVDRSGVLDQVAALSQGRADRIRALVEAHGMLTEVAPDTLAALGLPPDADVLVRADQLPGARVLAVPGLPEPSAAEGGAQARIEECDRRIRHIASLLDQRSVELDDARRSVDEFAVTAHEAAVRACEEAEQLARRRIDGGSLPVGPTPAELRRSELAAELEERRRRHHDFETLLDEERLGLLQLLESLEAERETLEGLRAELAGLDAAAVPSSAGDESHGPEAVPTPSESDDLPDPTLMAEVERSIREVLAGPPDAPLVPSLPAAALADQVAAHRQRQRDLQRDLNERGLDPAAIRNRLDEAHRAEARAAAEARPRTIPPEDEQEIERLHDEASDLVDKRTSRRHGKEATRRYEELTVELEALLDRHGFPTYAAYVMGRITPSIDEGARRRHEEAVALIARLERELEEATIAAASDPHSRMLEAERRQLWAAAEELLGSVPDDIETALRELRVPGPVAFDAPERLGSLLRRVGVTEMPATTNTLVETADQWLAEAKEAHDRARASAMANSGDDALGVRLPGGFTTAEQHASDPRAALAAQVAAQESTVEGLLARSTRLDAELAGREAESERLAHQIAALESELVSLDQQASVSSSVADPALDARIASEPTVVAAREQLTLTASRLERHHAAVERVDRLHAEIGQLRHEERSLVTERDSLRSKQQLAGSTQVATGLAPVEWDLGADGVDAIEWYLLGRVASPRSVSVAGSVPLVLDDAFRGLPPPEVDALCAALARIGESVQVIYVGDEPAVVDWATRQGLDHAAVVRPGQPAI